MTSKTISFSFFFRVTNHSLCMIIRLENTIIHLDVLTTPFLEIEIKEGVWCCGNEKASGPDGFTLKFLKHYWELIKKMLLCLLKISSTPVCWIEDVTPHLSL